ncbi:MAG TPA: FHA domain-containing protein [Tepidisphaeraceae bacterium]|jgi:pSer/pThr/pTyr-binding forkhead associated (FHA) protein|nr:FHA domain-containing protein [Tepidisphaeraceae bacterium]
MTLDADLNTAPSAALVPQGKHAGQTAIPLLRPATIIGARHRSHVHLLSRSVSKAHAILIRTNGGYYVRDLASRSHVYVNGRQVREADLVHGDLLKIGNFVFRFTERNVPSDRRPSTRAAEAAFEVEGSSMPFAVQDRSVLIGRRQQCDVSLIESSVSTAHALLFDMDGHWFLRDLSSRTGTWLNGTKIHQQEIRFGDEIRIGETSMRFVPSTADALRPQVDELEDLVGTAPLLEPEEADVLPQLLLPPDAPIGVARPVAVPEVPAAEAPVETADEPDALPIDEPLPLSFDLDEPAAPAIAAADDAPDAPAADEDDLLQMMLDEPEAPAASPPPAAPVGSGVPAPMGVIEAERRNAPPAKQPPAKGDDLVDLDQEQEIDLASDPDVSGPGETATLRLAPDDTQRKPSLSDRVVDPADNSDTISEAQRLLVDADLTADRLSSSATAADLQSAAEEAVAAANVEAGEADSYDALSLSDLSALDAPADDATPPPSDVELEPRRGWRRRSGKDQEAPAAAERPTPAPAKDVEAAAAAAPSPFEPTPARPAAPEPEPDTEAPFEFEPAAEAAALEGVEEDVSVDESTAPTAEAEAEPEAETIAASDDGEPQPIEDLSRLDFSALSLDSGAKSSDDVALDLSEPAAPSEATPELNLGMVPPDPEPTPPAGSTPVQPLIAADALELPAAPEPAKPRRGRKTAKKPAPVKPAPPAKAAPPPQPQPKPAAKPTRKRRLTKAELAAAAAAAVAPEAIESVEPLAADVTETPATPEPELEPTTASAEVIDTSEPTPESAFDLAEMDETDPSPMADGDNVDALTDTTFGRQLNDFAGDAPDPVIVESPLDESAELEPPTTAAPDSTEVVAEPIVTAEADEPQATEYVADVSPATDYHPATLDEPIADAPAPAEADTTEPAANADRPRSALEQIAASFSAADLDEVEADEPTAPVPSMGVLEADAQLDAGLAEPLDLTDATAEVPPTDVDPLADTGLATELVPEAPPEPPAAPEAAAVKPVVDETPAPVTELVADVEVEAPTEPEPELVAQVDAPTTSQEAATAAQNEWRMPDESDLLVPDDEPADGIADGRDSASFIGGVPLPLNPLGQPEASVPAIADEGAPVPELDLPELDLSPEPSIVVPSGDVDMPTPDDMLDFGDDAPSSVEPVSQTNEPEAPAPTAVVEPPSPAAAAASATVVPPQHLPPRPRQMGRRATPFAKTPFDEIPEPNGDSDPNAIPPFAGPGPATFGQVTTAFDGLAMPPVREADVFSHQVPGHVVGQNRQRPAAPTSSAKAPVIPPTDSTLGLTPETIEYASREPADVPAKAARPTAPGFRPPTMIGNAPEGKRTPGGKRKKWFGLKWLLPMMVFAMALVAGLIYAMVPVVTVVQGYVDYNNLDKVSPAKREQIQVSQMALVTHEETRKQAADILDKMPMRRGMNPGFLASTQEAAIARDRNVSISFPPPGTRMVVRVKSTDPARDTLRLQALLTHVSVATASMTDRAHQLKELERSQKAKLAENERNLMEQEIRLAQARRAGNNRPPGEDVIALENELKTLETARSDAFLRVTDLQTELDQLKSANPAAAPDRLASVQAQLEEAQRVADAAGNAATNADRELRKMLVARMEAQSAYEKQQELERSIASLKAQRQELQQKTVEAVAEADSVVTMTKFVEGTITASNPEDPRLMYVVISTVAIWLVFVILIAVTWKSQHAPATAEEINDGDGFDAADPQFSLIAPQRDPTAKETVPA